jgi:cysteine synthase A
MHISKTIRDRFGALDAMIGHTPLLALHFRFHGQDRVVYAKAEYLNLTGSIKDRMALHMLRRAYIDGRLAAGDTIAEATSGNTGISLAAIGRALDHPVVIYMPDWMSSERQALIRAYGAQIVGVSQEQGGFLGSISFCHNYASSRPHVFLPCQFSNADNPAAHEASTGPEIVQQMQSANMKVGGFVAGVGTGGTVMGVGRFLRKCFPDVRLHPLEPAESPTLSTGYKVGQHRIQGISDEFIPTVCKLKELNDVVSVADGDAILMAQKLAAGIGLGVGPSSGANFLGALQVQNSLRGDANVVTVFPDDNKKYLSTDLFRNEKVKESYLSLDVELLGYEALECVA